MDFDALSQFMANVNAGKQVDPMQVQRNMFNQMLINNMQKQSPGQFIYKGAPGTPPAQPNMQMPTPQGPLVGG